MPVSLAQLGERLYSDLYCNYKFFGTPDDYDVVAAVVLPEWFGRDADNLRLRCLRTGKISGGVVGDADSPWPAVFAPMLPPHARIVQAKFTDFSAFSRDDDGSLRTPCDLRLEVVDAFANPFARDCHCTWYGQRKLPVPPRENIIRVAGDVGTDGFLLGGATWHDRLRLLVRRYMGCETRELERILDWGVGCGRIARHFLEDGQTNIHGADIDDVNVDWLRANLGWSNAIRIDFDPPMPYPDEYFDVIYAHSVFTHLSYGDHFSWLAEIKRVLKPDGMAFLTVATESGLYLTRPQDAERRFSGSFLEDGFVDVESQSFTGVDAGRDGYYRLVFQTRKFVSDEWAHFFRINRIIPCFAEHQDLVVVQKTR